MTDSVYNLWEKNVIECTKNVYEKRDKITIHSLMSDLYIL